MRPTTVTLVGIDPEPSPREVAELAGRARNVALVLEDPGAPEAERFERAWAEVERRRAAIYVLTDADPLRALGEGYVASWREERRELLDVAALVPPPKELPEFYLVLDAGEPDADPHGERFLRREWFLGVLAAAAPVRVLPVRPLTDVEETAARLLQRLARLPSGTPLPAAAELLERARRRVPGQP